MSTPEPTFSRWGMTMRTPDGPVDLVPLQRRLEGDKTTEVLADERDAAVLALTHLGVPAYQINKVLNMSHTEMRKVLSRYGMEPVMATPTEAIAWTGVAQTSSSQRRAKRLAERIEVDGRPFHPFAPHGTELAYTEYGCHCQPCRAAHAAKLAEYRSKKKMRAAA